MALKDRFKEVKNDFKLTNKSFGDLLGVSESSIAKILSGGGISTKLLTPLGIALGVNIDWLLFGRGQKYVAAPQGNIQIVTGDNSKAQVGNNSYNYSSEENKINGLLTQIRVLEEYNESLKSNIQLLNEKVNTLENKIHELEKK